MGAVALLGLRTGARQAIGPQTGQELSSHNMGLFLAGQRLTGFPHHFAVFSHNFTKFEALAILNGHYVVNGRRTRRSMILFAIEGF